MPGELLFDLTGRRALVTGSSRGIGYAIAEGLALAGATVGVNGRNVERTLAARDRLRERLACEDGAGEIHAVPFDVSDYDGMLAAVAAFDADVGGIDILVNNAGIQYRSPVIDFPLDEWQRVLSTNLTSCFLLAQQVARGMLDRGQGKVINVCSVQNKLVRGATAAYAAAKSALGTLGQVMCADWAAHGVQVNGLAPGYIDTELNSALIDDPVMNEWVIGRTPARRWGTPADLVGPAIWLASSASDFVNGQVIFVDGGMTAVM